MFNLQLNNILQIDFLHITVL